jgi:putative inorganic carbon (HCO3(-)) transporter
VHLAPRHLSSPLAGGGLLAPLAALLGAGAVAALTVRSPQLGCAAALIGAVLAAYAGRPAVGLLALWALWLLVPALRRMLGLETGYVSSDPLSVAPILATIGVGALALGSVRLTRRPRLVLALAGFGLALGLPAGAGAPAAALFGLVAYAAGLAGFVLGWAEAREGISARSLERALLVAAPALAGYGLYQYFVELPAWDVAWLESVPFSSVGSPEEERVRIFSTLNSPGLLGLVLAVALLVLVGRRRLGMLPVAAMALAAVGLALTYVRSAWLALVVGLVGLALASRGRALPRLLPLALALALAFGVLAVDGDTSDAVLERAGTLGELGSDTSAQARQATPLELLPEIAGLPFGHGLGTAGEASRLSDGEGLRASDNGYLALAYQLGLPGALLVLSGLALPAAAAVRGALTQRSARLAVLVGVLAAYVVLLASGDQLYGLAGVVLWYVLGAALGEAEVVER